MNKLPIIIRENLGLVMATFILLRSFKKPIRFARSLFELIFAFALTVENKIRSFSFPYLVRIENDKRIFSGSYYTWNESTVFTSRYFL